MNPKIHDAVILGAGFGGLGAGATLIRNGIDDFLIVEQANDLGGVWRDNTYPGAACDTQAPIYCYSYFLNTGISTMYAGQTELLRYLHALSAEFGLDKQLRFNSRVTGAEWDDYEGYWRIFLADGEQLLGRVFIPAWGQLSMPHMPRFTGQDEFAGVQFHSASWRHDIDLAGLRVATVGAAASAVQYVPEVARTAGQLVVFQRSPNYILPRGQVVFSAEQRNRFQTTPHEFRALRNEIHKMREEGFARTRLHTSAHQEGADEARRHLEAQIADPALRAALWPDYEFGCKRILRSDDYYPALDRGNVTLETSAIAEFTERGITTADGTFHELDVVIYGTGFRSQAFQGATRVIGRDGVDLADRWGSTPEAYLGMTVDGFPNMFLVYGPNTNLNHNSVASMLELQHDYIAQAVLELIADAQMSMDVRPEVLRRYNEELQAALADSAYSAECSSWYKNDAGLVINNWSGTVDEYAAVTRALSPNDYRQWHEPAV